MSIHTCECLKTQTSSCHLTLQQLPCCYQPESSPWTPPCSQDCTEERSDRPQTALESSCPIEDHQHPDKHNTNFIIQPAMLNVSAKCLHAAHHGKKQWETMDCVSSYPSGPTDSLKRETQTHNSSHILHKGHLDANTELYQFISLIIDDKSENYC